MGDLRPIFSDPSLKPKTPDGELSIPAPRICPRCQGVNPGRFTRVCPGCEPIEEADRVEKEKLRRKRDEIARATSWLESSGIPRRYRQSSFATFKRELQPQAYDTAKRYLETELLAGKEGEPIEEEAPSLMLSSRGNGTGKTHLAVAVAGEFMLQWSQYRWDVFGSQRPPVLFTTIPKMLLRLHATYRDDAKESETDVIEDLSTVRLLVLDDVGKEKPSDHTRQTYFTVIDARYGADLPIIITSNLTLPKQLKELNNIMGEASMSRLKEMTEGWRVVMDGEDYRFQDKMS